MWTHRYQNFDIEYNTSDEKINQANEEVRIGLATIESTLGLTPEEGLRNTTSSYYTEAIEFAEKLTERQQENINKYQKELESIKNILWIVINPFFFAALSIVLLVETIPAVFMWFLIKSTDSLLNLLI